jgi:serine/threonine-protein kinase
VPLILPEGSQLSNRYQVVKILDVSPLRNIYMVQDLHLRGNTWVAKQILPSGSDPIGSGNVRKRFEDEARIIGTLEHPSIPKLLDFFFKDRCFFIIREYVPGTDLGTLLAFQGGSLSESDALRLTIPIAELLGFLLRKNLGSAIFREISLGSFIVTPNGELRLVDLGFTRLFGKANTIGAVDYAAPEQFSGAGMDSRTVVYNMGAMLYHVLGGFNPGESPFNLEPLDALAPQTSDATLKIVEKAMQRDPKSRYSSPEDMAKALKKARTAVEKRKGAGKGSGKDVPADSDTQPLEPSFSVTTWLLAAIILIFLGAGCYAAYEMVLKGSGG